MDGFSVDISKLIKVSGTTYIPIPRDIGYNYNLYVGMKIKYVLDFVNGKIILSKAENDNDNYSTFRLVYRNGRVCVPIYKSLNFDLIFNGYKTIKLISINKESFVLCGSNEITE